MSVGWFGHWILAIGLRVNSCYTPSQQQLTTPDLTRFKHLFNINVSIISSKQPFACIPLDNNRLEDHLTESTPQTESSTPKDRLLDAAEQLFASKGFAEVSVRELAAAADVNLAAVNYHFQGKENLFHEVIIRRFSAQRDRTLGGLQAVLQQSAGRPQVDEVIRVMVHEYLAGAMSNSFLTLVIRDMHSGKSGTHIHFFKEMVQPVFKSFSQALMAARPNLGQEDVSWVIASIIGQIHHFIMRRIKCESCTEIPEIREIMHQAFPALALDRDQYIHQTTDRITRFSTAAIDGLYPEEN